jgi:RimJ/RimL family protein N-acetyltransferase
LVSAAVLRRAGLTQSIPGSLYWTSDRSVNPACQVEMRTPGTNRPIEAPLLETERLTLRAHRADDLAEAAAMWADPGVYRHIGGKPFTEQQVWSKILVYRGHWTLMGFGYWAVEDKTSGRFIGELGFADFKRDIAPSIKGVPELGWVLAPHAHGKGRATEALRAVVAWGDRNFAAPRTVCIIDPENAASIRVAEKCGYRELQRTAYNGAATVMYSRDEFERGPRP